MLSTILVGGVLTSIAITLVVLATYVLCPHVFLAELTHGKEHGPPLITAAVAVSITLMMVGGAALTCAWATPAEPLTFWQRTLIAYGVIAFFCLYDLFIIDVVIYDWIKPPFMRFEGYPRLDIWHHTKASLKGLVPIGIPMALLAGYLGGRLPNAG
ncbi:MAG: hypothetical protein AAGA68_16810 [Pseudomonadota bacterium]